MPKWRNFANSGHTASFYRWHKNAIHGLCQFATDVNWSSKICRHPASIWMGLNRSSKWAFLLLTFSNLLLNPITIKSGPDNIGSANSQQPFSRIGKVNESRVLLGFYLALWKFLLSTLGVLFKKMLHLKYLRISDSVKIECAIESWNVKPQVSLSVPNRDYFEQVSLTVLDFFGRNCQS